MTWCTNTERDETLLAAHPDHGALVVRKVPMTNDDWIKCRTIDVKNFNQGAEELRAMGFDAYVKPYRK